MHLRKCTNTGHFHWQSISIAICWAPCYSSRYSRHFRWSTSLITSRPHGQMLSCSRSSSPPRFSAFSRALSITRSALTLRRYVTKSLNISSSAGARLIILITHRLPADAMRWTIRELWVRDSGLTPLKHVSSYLVCQQS